MVGNAHERAVAAKAPWPGTIREQTQTVRAALAELTAPATAEELAARFTGARKARVREILEALANLGGAHELPDGRFAP